MVDRDGVRLQVDISDYIGHYLYFGFDDPSMRTLFSLCTSTSHVLDIGANIGWTGLRMAAIAKEGSVTGFEPDTFNYGQCVANVKRNAMSNIHIYPLALGGMSGKVPMEVRIPSNLGGNRIVPDRRSGGSMVDMVELDNFLLTHPVKQVDLIKVDVEGFELHVLRGAERTLQRYKPTLFVEVDDNNLIDQGDSAQALIKFLEDHGYTRIANAKTGQSVNSNQLFDGCHIDIIAS